MFKVFFQSSDAHHRMDNPMFSQLVGQFSVVKNEDEADVVLVMATSLPTDYVFNTELMEMKKPWVLLDTIEYGWAWQAAESHVFGKSPEKLNGLFNSSIDQWILFDEFVRSHPPIVYFKRELHASEVTSLVKPIEYLCYASLPNIQSQQEFDARPIEVFYNWGESHPLRPQLHAEIFQRKNCEIISQWEHINSFLSQPSHGRAWISMFTPHYARKHYSEVIKVQQMSKISVSLPGCGIKCFRSNESNVGSIMALVEDNLAWTYPYEHGVNCIRIRRDNLFDDLVDATHRTDLHEIYVRSQHTADKYRPQRYVKEYMVPLVRSRI